jgi:hypothetical protein
VKVASSFASFSAFGSQRPDSERVDQEEDDVLDDQRGLASSQPSAIQAMEAIIKSRNQRR